MHQCLPGESFVDRLNEVFRFLHSLRGSEDQVLGIIGMGQAKPLGYPAERHAGLPSTQIRGNLSPAAVHRNPILLCSSRS